MTLTWSDVAAALDYNPLTGIFIWRRGRNIGKRAGTICSGNTSVWRQIYLDGRKYREHRLAWFYTHGRWPNGEIDHRDINSLNNAMENLREATHSQNNANRRANRNNCHGLKGIVRAKQCKQLWRARIVKNRKCIHLGYFATPEEAAKAYERAAHHYFGEFARAS